MMIARTLNIQWRLSLLCGACLLAIVTVLSISANIQSKRSTELAATRSSQALDDIARQQLAAASDSQAQRIERYFNQAQHYAEGIAEQVSLQQQAYQAYDADPRALRLAMSQLLQARLRAHPEWLGLYLVFEPNALDEADGTFIDQAVYGSNERGRFALSWSQLQPGQLQDMVFTEEMIDDSSLSGTGEPANSWYRCPQQQRHACLIEPYFVKMAGKNVLMSSLSIPLMVDGRVIGSLGVDFSLMHLQELATQANGQLYESQGRLRLLSPTHLLASDSAEDSGLGKPLDAADQLSLADDIPGRIRLHNGQMRLSRPVAALANNPAWILSLEIPHEALQAPINELNADLAAINRTSTQTNLGLGCAAVLMGFIAIWRAIRAVTVPLSHVSNMTHELTRGDGDLTQRLKYPRHDELGSVVEGFNALLSRLQDSISEVKASADATHAAAVQSQQVASQINQGMQTQSSEVEQVATAMHEMSATAHAVADHASEATLAVREVDSSVGQGLQVIDSTTRTINILSEQLDSTMQMVAGLAASSEQIGSVLDVIKAIAEQTNLLALNAAIEAARAGDQGRGFAVVADEVRNLARRTQTSVEEIREVIENLQSGTRDVVGSMQISHRHARQSVQDVGEAVTNLRKIGNAVGIMSDMNLQIASAAEQQSQVAAEISNNLSRVRDLTQTLSGQATQSADISQDLASLSTKQQAEMAHFRV